MKKKDYVSPLMTTVQLDMVKLICASQDITSDKGITYGGVDEEGTLDPASRCRRRDVWDEDEEED